MAGEVQPVTPAVALSSRVGTLWNSVAKDVVACNSINSCKRNRDTHSKGLYRAADFVPLFHLVCPVVYVDLVIFTEVCIYLVQTLSKHVLPHADGN